MGKRKTYSREFKQKAIRLVLEEDRPATQARGRVMISGFD